jgi:hypothetical protein
METYTVLRDVRFTNLPDDFPTMRTDLDDPIRTMTEPHRDWRYYATLIDTGERIDVNADGTVTYTGSNPYLADLANAPQPQSFSLGSAHQLAHLANISPALTFLHNPYSDAHQLLHPHYEETLARVSARVLEDVDAWPSWQLNDGDTPALRYQSLTEGTTPARVTVLSDEYAWMAYRSDAQSWFGHLLATAVSCNSTYFPKPFSIGQCAGAELTEDEWQHAGDRDIFRGDYSRWRQAAAADITLVEPAPRTRRARPRPNAR